MKRLGENWRKKGSCLANHNTPLAVLIRNIRLKKEIEEARDGLKVGDVFYYADEFNVSWLPTLRAMWSPKGQQVMIPTPGQPVVRSAAGRLVLLYLPTYSPWLNPIEMLWRHFRREVTHCELFETVKVLIEAADDFFRRYNKNPEKVLSIIGAHPATLM